MCVYKCNMIQNPCQWFIYSTNKHLSIVILYSKEKYIFKLKCHWQTRICLNLLFDKNVHSWRSGYKAWLVFLFSQLSLLFVTFLYHFFLFFVPFISFLSLFISFLFPCPSHSLPWHIDIYDIHVSLFLMPQRYHSIKYLVEGWGSVWGLRGWVACCRIWSCSPMQCEKHGPRDSVTKTEARVPCFSHSMEDHDQILL